MTVSYRIKEAIHNHIYRSMSIFTVALDCRILYPYGVKGCESLGHNQGIERQKQADLKRLFLKQGPESKKGLRKIP
ncbi:hypothetical protein HRM2_47950 [Desulforapulum autotrophicum HRM2]|uniref:Uncharacterized protein n=1 Tax=Desulforapulum autotrophicum (strain ATCC 43914 / DSM 3382 / VKM B-1955 / HRM2) TaxID=177437 RepID=C0QHI5_DESAH|nr:hypothetical protein HRM2_47950 [Desulforapulum autotrophicum HRM2]